jgi:hypothetical protein
MPPRTRRSTRGGWSSPSRTGRSPGRGPLNSIFPYWLPASVMRVPGSAALVGVVFAGAAVVAAEGCAAASRDPSPHPEAGSTRAPSAIAESRLILRMGWCLATDGVVTGAREGEDLTRAALPGSSAPVSRAGAYEGSSSPRWRRKRWKSRAIVSAEGIWLGVISASVSSAASSRRSTNACTSGSLRTASLTWRS